MVNLYKLDLCDCVDLSSGQKHTTATLPLAVIGPGSVVWEACGGPVIVRVASRNLCQRSCQTSVLMGKTMCKNMKQE